MDPCRKKSSIHIIFHTKDDFPINKENIYFTLNMRPPNYKLINV